jgi:ABC-type dipeptide/oligopeptide/nickel transport system ATPase subunit
MIEAFSQNKDFFGRETVLSKIGEALLPSNDMVASEEPGSIKSVVLCGPAGFGKTEIAVEFVFSQHKKFDAVFWLRAEDETKLDFDFRQIAIELGLQSPTQSHTPVVTRNLVTQWLSNPKRVLNANDEPEGFDSATWLLIFDNADHLEFIPDYIVDNGRGSILITSRNPAAKELFWQSTFPLDVEKFDLKEGVEFLKRQSKKRDQLDICQKIVEHYDGHPLALAQIAGFVRHEFLSFSDVLDYVHDPNETPRLFDHVHGIQKTARGTVPDICKAGLSQLPSTSRALLELLSFLDPDRIQEKILSQDGIGQYHQARRPLLQSSLIRRNEKNNELYMHRVDQDVVKNSLNPQKRIDTFQKAVQLIKESWPVVEFRKRHTVARWPLCEGLFPHVLKLQDYYKSQPHQYSAEVEINLAILLQEASWLVNPSPLFPMNDYY